MTIVDSIVELLIIFDESDDTLIVLLSHKLFRLNMCLPVILCHLKSSALISHSFSSKYITKSHPDLI